MNQFIEKIKKIELNNIIYFFWGIYVLANFLGMVGIICANDICLISLKYIRYICYLVFALKICYDSRKDKKISIIFIVLFIIAIMITILAKNNGIICTLIMLATLKKLDFDKLIKIAFKIFSVAFFITVGLTLLKILPNWEFNRGTLTRYSLGFDYAATGVSVYLVTIMMYFYIRKNNATYMELLVLELINIFVYRYTDGRLGFVLITLILLVQLLSKFEFIINTFNSKFIQKLLKIICHTLPIILFILYHLLIIMYANNSPIANKANKLLSNRIKLTYQAYRNYDVKLFGDNIKWYSWAGYGYSETDEDFTYNLVDTAYSRMIFDYGLIFSALLILGYREILIKNYNEKNYWLLFVIIFVLIWAFLEPIILNLGRNAFALALMPLLDIGQINLSKKEKNNAEQL